MTGEAGTTSTAAAGTPSAETTPMISAARPSLSDATPTVRRLVRSLTSVMTTSGCESSERTLPSQAASSAKV